MKIKFVLLTILFLLIAPAISSGAEKIITDYKGDKIIGLQLPPTKSFDRDILDFPIGPSTSPGAITVDLVNKTANLGNSAVNSCGVLWYGGTTDPLAGNCVGGKCNFDTGFRAYFEFTSSTDNHANSTTRGHGFTFTVMNGFNNDNTRRGGPPTPPPVIDMGELLCYAGSGNKADELGLQYPKMAIEFDTYPNPGATSNEGCSNGRYDNYNTNPDTNANHVSLMFWGTTSTSNCDNGSVVDNAFNNTIRGSYDDNIHRAGTEDSTTVPRNSYRGTPAPACSVDPIQSVCGYYERTKGASTYNWMEDGQTHKVRIEVTRATTAATSGCAANTYAYNVKAWVDCELLNTPYTACPANEYVYFRDVFNDYSNASYLPKINRTVCLSSALHGNFSTMLFGFTEATGTGTITQNIEIKNFAIYFMSAYRWCAYENPTPGAPGPFICSFSGTKHVAYGANGFYYYQDATGSIPCNNATFGDPIVGTLKNCYYK